MATKRKPSISGMKRPEVVSRDKRPRSQREKLFGVEAPPVICGRMETLEQHLTVRLPRQAVTCQLPEYLPAFGRDQQLHRRVFPRRSPGSEPNRIPRVGGGENLTGQPGRCAGPTPRPRIVRSTLQPDRKFRDEQQYLTQLPAIRSPWPLQQDERTSPHKRRRRTGRKPSKPGTKIGTGSIRAP